MALTGISHYYCQAGAPSPRLNPTVAGVLAGVQRSRRKEPDYASRPLSAQERAAGAGGGLHATG